MWVSVCRFSIDEIVSGDNIEAFEFLVFKRLEYLRVAKNRLCEYRVPDDRLMKLPEGWSWKMCNEDSAVSATCRAFDHRF